MSFNGVLDDVRGQLVRGVARRRRRERMHRWLAVAAVLAVAIAAGGVALAARDDSRRVVTTPEPSGEGLPSAAVIAACDARFDVTSESLAPVSPEDIARWRKLALASGDRVLADVGPRLADLKATAPQGEVPNDSAYSGLLRRAIDRCRELRVPDYTPRYVAGTLGPEPLVTLEHFGIVQQLDNGAGTIPSPYTPAGRDLSPVVIATAGRDPTRVVATWSYTGDHGAGRWSCYTAVNGRSCRTGRDALPAPLGTPTVWPAGSDGLVGVTFGLSRDASFVVLGVDDNQYVQRPASGLAVFAVKAGSRYNAISYDANGQVLGRAMCFIRDGKQVC